MKDHESPSRSTPSRQARSSAGSQPAGLRGLQASHGNHRVQQMVDGPMRSGGAPVDDSIRVEAERRFGASLGDVRVHTDSAAAASARELRARAYASGRDIVFAPAQYAPHSSRGRNLLLHELAHVVQQSRGTSAGTIGAAGDVHERAASAAAAAVGAGGLASLPPSSAVPAVQREEDTTDAPTKEASADASSGPPRLMPPEPPPETDEERLNRMLAEDATKGDTRRGRVPPGGVASIIPGSEASLAAAVRRMLARCEADARHEGQRTPTRPGPAAGGARADNEDSIQELTRRIEACLETPEGQQLEKQAKEVLLSRRNAPITIAAYLASIGVRQSGSISKTIRLHDDLDLTIGAQGSISTKENVLLVTFKLRGSWLERAAAATWGGIKTVGGAIGAAGVTVGRAVGTAGVAVGRAVGTAGSAVGRSIWSGLKAFGRGVASVGGAIWTGIKATGRAIATAAGAVWTGLTWVGRQLWDKVTGIVLRIGHWLDRLPARVGRLLLGLWEGVKSIKPWSLAWWKSLGDASTWGDFLKWIGARLVDLVELMGFGEAYETVMDFLKFNTRSLTANEVRKASAIFGSSINFPLVRVDHRAVIGPAFSGRDYTSFHTINSWGDSGEHVLMHELTHVWQYEQVGAIYMPQALHAQLFGDGYDYGGSTGLRTRQAAGKGFGDLNREQQGQLVQDFSMMRQSDPDIALYASFVKYVSTLSTAQLIAGRPS